MTYESNHLTTHLPDLPTTFGGIDEVMDLCRGGEVFSKLGGIVRKRNGPNKITLNV